MSFHTENNIIIKKLRKTNKIQLIFQIFITQTMFQSKDFHSVNKILKKILKSHGEIII